MKKILSLTILFFFNLFLIQFVSAIKIEDVKPTDYVTDYTNTLTQEQVLEISKTLGQIEKEKSYQIAVVMIDKMQDEFGRDDYIEHFAVKLYEKLGLGTKEKDEGMLWLISKDDRQMRMEVGYGLEPVLTDGVTKNIQDSFVKSQFKNGNYYEAIRLGTTMVSNVLLGRSENSPPFEGGSVRPGVGPMGGYENFFSIIIFILIFGVNILGWLFAIMARTKSWWLGGVVTFFLGFSILYFIFGLNPVGDLILFIFTLGGFLFDYLISKNYKYWEQQFINGNKNARPSWWAGGGWGPSSGNWRGGGWNNSSGSGFGGFGGGMSGGGGSSSSW